jgi:hypothetical protein
MTKRKYYTEDDDKEDLFSEDPSNENEEWPNVDHMGSDENEDDYINGILEKEGIKQHPDFIDLEEDFNYHKGYEDYDTFNYEDDDEEDDSGEYDTSADDQESDEEYDESEDDYEEDYSSPSDDALERYISYDDDDNDNDNELFRRARRNRRSLEDEREKNFDIYFILIIKGVDNVSCIFLKKSI